MSCERSTARAICHTNRALEQQNYGQPIKTDMYSTYHTLGSAGTYNYDHYLVDGVVILLGSAGLGVQCLSVRLGSWDTQNGRCKNRREEYCCPRGRLLCSSTGATYYCFFIRSSHRLIWDGGENAAMQSWILVTINGKFQIQVACDMLAVFYSR